MNTIQFRMEMQYCMFRKTKSEALCQFAEECCPRLCPLEHGERLEAVKRGYTGKAGNFRQVVLARLTGVQA